MCKKTFNSLVFFLCAMALSHLSLLFPANGSVLGLNVFFDQSKELLRELEHELAVNAQESCSSEKENLSDDFQTEQAPVASKANNDQALIILNGLESFINKLGFKTFTLRGIGTFELEKMFYSMNLEQDKFLKNDEIHLSKTNAEKVSAIFDLIRAGACYELSFDHLVVFRESLICNLDEILTLVNYWTEQINNDTVFQTFQKAFVDEIDKDELKLKVRKLSFMRDRISTYLGKVDELFFKFFNGPGSFEHELSDQPLAQQCGYFKTFVTESSFCINSFFSEMTDPDKTKYNERLKVFLKISMLERSELVCKNHAGLQLLENAFSCQLDDYRIPNFLKRHWLLVSVGGVASVGLGIYLYKNWEHIAGDDPASIKNRAINWSTETGKWIGDGYADLKEKFWPKQLEGKEKDGKGLKYILKNDLKKLNNSKEGFGTAFRNKFNDLKQRNEFADLRDLDIDDLNTIDMSRILQVLNQHNGRIAGVAENVNRINDELKGKKNRLVREFDELIRRLLDDRDGSADQVRSGGAANVVRPSGFAARVSGWFGRQAERGARSLPTVDQAAGIIEHAAEQINNFGERMKSVADRPLDDGQEGPPTPGVARNTLNSLKDVIDGFVEMINALPAHQENLGVYGQLYEVIVYKLIYDILHLFHKGLSRAAEKIDDGYTKITVLLNWVSILLPVLLTSVVLPTLGFSIMHKISKNIENRKYNKINFMISQIYRTLNYYTSSVYDYYHNELRYKDQGVLSFWLESLNESIENISNGDRSKLRMLISDLQNPKLSVAQKINFIKLEWGKHLFGSEMAA